MTQSELDIIEQAFYAISLFSFFYKESAMAPFDLQSFWQQTRAVLQQTPLQAILSEAPEHSGREYQTFGVTLDSFEGKHLRAWYTIPRDTIPRRTFPAVLAVPGYGGDKAIPTHLAISGFAVLTWYSRGQGESRQEWVLEHSSKLTYHVTDKERYHYRGAYMDCLRGLDFLASRPERDASRLGCGAAAKVGVNSGYRRPRSGAYGVNCG
jgi:cephalosporin-C deacetylase-like acetyl esterase